jgi:hypothetical protein
MAEKEVEIDPDVLDLVIQSVSVLSNVATIASAWWMLRDRSLVHPSGFSDTDSIRQQLRVLRRNLEDTFEAVEAILRIIEEGVRAGAPSPLAQQPRFGFGVMLTREDLIKMQPFLGQLDGAQIQARGAVRSLQIMMDATNMAPSFNVTFTPENLVAQLNSILFESSNLGEAVTKLRLARQDAEDFVSNLERALRRN